MESLLLIDWLFCCIYLSAFESFVSAVFANLRFINLLRLVVSAFRLLRLQVVLNLIYTKGLGEWSLCY